VAQSTVALRLARFEEALTSRVATTKIIQQIAGEGFLVSDQTEVPGVRFDLVASKENARVAIEIATAAESDQSARSRESSLRRRMQLEQFLMATERSQDVNLAVVAVYFRRDGALSFYDARKLMGETSQNRLQLYDGLSHSTIEPHWTLTSLVQERLGLGL